MALIDLDRMPQIKRVFVGRKRELMLFEDAAHAIPDDHCSLLVFHGLGGRGKTWLCEEILRACRADPNYTSLTVGHLDLHSKPDAAKRDALMALVFVRNAFAEQKLSFPVFDLALALAWEANRSEEPYPKLKNPWLRRASTAADDLTAEGADDIKDWLSGENVASVIGDEIGKVPLVGTLLTRGGRWMVSKAKLAWLHRAHDDLKRLYQPDSRQLKAPGELQALLPFMLAVDLNRAAREKSDGRLVLLIDEYERVFEQAGGSDGLFENRFDAAIRALLGHSERFLAVFFGRERLPWRKGDPVAALLADRQHELPGLSRAEADEHLHAIPVADEKLRAAIIDGALETPETVYPLLLELQVEHWAALTGAGKAPLAEAFRFDDDAFQPRLQAMVERFLRDYGDPMRATLNRLAYLRRFDKQCFRFVLEEFLTALPLERFDHLTRLSFFREAGDGWLALHGRIAEALARMKSADFALETRQKLFEHFDERATAESNLTVTDAHVAALSEAQAIRHEMPGFEVGYVAWLYSRSHPIQQAARYTQCQALWELVLERLTPIVGRDNLYVATTLNNLAGLLEAQARYDEALPLYRRALGIREKELGPDHPDVATTLNNLAELYRSQGLHGEALPLYQRALSILERVLRPDHPHMAAALNNLALMYKTLGRYDEALTLYKRVLDIREKALRPDHPHVATTLNNLAGLHKAQGRYNEAQPLYQRALGISEKALGPDHPNVATTLNNLAGLYGAQGRDDEALPLYQRALGIREKTLGPDHPHVATTLNNLAGLHKAQGRYDEALPLYQRALVISEKALGPDHPDVATTLNNLAGLHRAHGRTDEALPLYRRALVISEKAIGPDHPQVATTLNNLALLHEAQGRYDEALPLYQRALVISEKALGPDHPDVATTLNNLAGLHRAHGRTDEALPLYRRALVISEKAIGPDHPQVATTLNNLALLHEAQGRYDEALPLHQRALGIREKALGPDHPDVATTLNNLALLHKAQGRTDEALPLQQRAVAILEKTFPAGHPNLETVRTNLASLQGATK